MQVEVKTALPSSPVKDGIYLEQPPGSIQERNEEKVWKLKNVWLVLNKQVARGLHT